MKALCEVLTWDSEFFGVPIGRVIGHQIEAGQALAIRQWCAEQGIACLYFLADTEPSSNSRIAEELGFRLADIRITFEIMRPKSIAPFPHNPRFRLARADDYAALQQTARTAYQQSRFYADPCFPREKASALYDVWLKRSIQEGYADATWVATDDDERPIGYITCHRDATEGRIGLVGVAETARGQGIALALLERSLAWFWEQGMESVSVVTQGRNIGAQRLYQRAQFVTRAVQLWYHLWLYDCSQTV